MYKILYKPSMYVFFSLIISYNARWNDVKYKNGQILFLYQTYQLFSKYNVILAFSKYNFKN